MKPVDIADLRGGYFTDVPSEQLRENELLVGLNCYWDNGVIKRNGIGVYATNSWAATNVVLGYHRLWVPTETAWHTILAVADASTVQFYWSTSTGVTAINSSYTWTIGNQVEMDSMDGEIIAANGANKPAFLYHDGSGWIVSNLETYDTRTRATTNWYAGYYDYTGATPALKYLDDSTDAKDADADDCDLNQAAQYDGVWVACDYTFNRLRLYGTTALATDLVAQFTYYKGSAVTQSWGQVGTLTGLTLDAAATNHTVEWNYPTDWAVGESTFPANLQNRYIFKLTFDTQPSATAVFDYLDIAHTQYLTQIFDDERPRTVRVHKNHFWLGFDNVANHSPYHRATGWRVGDAYYFEEGGRVIKAMESHGEYLAIVKDGGVHGVFGNSFANFYQKFLTKGGTVSGRSVVVRDRDLFMADRDGIYRWDGAERVKISKHIHTDYDSWVTSNVASVFYKNWILMAFPSNETALIFDPDTFRNDDMGDGRVSFWKFNNYRVDQFAYHSGAGDNGYLLGAANFATPRLLRCDNGAYDSISVTTAIDMQTKTKFFSFGNLGTYKHFGRLKVRVHDMATVTGATCSIAIYADDGDASTEASFVVAAGSGWWSTDMALPYTIDGKNLSILFEHQQVIGARLGGYSLDYESRRY